jgi:hypothetical protein
MIILWDVVWLQANGTRLLAAVIPTGEEFD